MVRKDSLNELKAALRAVDGGVLGKIAYDLVSRAADPIKDDPYARRIRVAVEEYAASPEGPMLLETVAMFAHKEKRRPLFPRRARDVAKDAMAGAEEISVEAWAKTLLREVELTYYRDETRQAFLLLLGEVQRAAADYWKGLLDTGNLAVADYVAESSGAEGEEKEMLKDEVRDYLFASSVAPMSESSPLKTRILECNYCGRKISPKDLTPMKIAGVWGYDCPCGATLTFGEYTDDGRKWAKEFDRKLDAVLREIAACGERLDEVLGEIAAAQRRFLGQVRSRRQKLFEVTHAPDIDEDIVVDYARLLLELVPDDVLANFYVLVSENNSLVVNRFLDTLDVRACGSDAVCAMLDYLVEPLEPRMEGALLSLVDRAFAEGVFDRGTHTKYMTAIQEGKYFDPLAEYDLFIAYKSADRAEVEILRRELEGQELTCFVSYRDLPHGRGSGGINYWNRLKLAMDNSRGIVFVSTPNSRSLKCDAIHREDETVDSGEGELYYFEKHFPREEKIRIEYRPPSDVDKPAPRSIQHFLKRFFGTVHYCTTPEDVADLANKFLYPDLYREAELPSEPAFAPAHKRPAADGTEHGKTKERGGMSEEAPSAPPKKRVAKGSGKKSAEAEHGQDVPPPSPPGSFQIESGVLKKFVGEETEVAVPEGVREIGEDAFSNCTALRRVVLPSTVTAVRGWAFWGCSGLESITLPATVSEIGWSAFLGCTHLKTVLFAGSKGAWEKVRVDLLNEDLKRAKVIFSE